jgi:SAM-dependent methyltransferase
VSATREVLLPAPGHEVPACPACGLAGGRQIGREVAGYDTVVGAAPLRMPAYAIRCCAQCRLYFKSHTLAHEELDRYYSHFEPQGFDGSDDFPSDRILQRILSNLPPGAKVLDFGCSSGRILRRFTTRLDTYGVEINEKAAKLASERGIRITSEEEIRRGITGPFDAIILADVYEHLVNPVEMLAMLVGAMRPGGTLAILTGNADAIRTRDWIGEFWYFRPEGHFQMASEEHMTWLANRLSLRLEHLYKCSHYDIPMTARLRQFIQSFAYGHFKRSPGGLVSSVLRLLPVLKRAQHWPVAPALTYTQDHFVAVMKKN